MSSRSFTSPVIISVVGASSSGKTALATNIAKRFKPHQVSVIVEDSYYNNQDHMTFKERLNTNYDHPDSMDHALLLEHLEALCAGQTIECPQYDYSNHTRSKTVIEQAPTPVIIVEGILLYTQIELLKRFDLKLFVDTPLDICLARRIKRDVAERGRTVESIIEQYENTVRPMFLQFIEPSKRFADLIVPTGGHNEMALAVMEAKIQRLID